jgi:hypothetical protein
MHAWIHGVNAYWTRHIGASSKRAELAVTKPKCHVKSWASDVTFTRNVNYYGNIHSRHLHMLRTTVTQNGVLVRS